MRESFVPSYYKKELSKLQQLTQKKDALIEREAKEIRDKEERKERK